MSSFTWPDGKRVALSLSFDDARVSQVTQGIPILDRHNVKGTFYVSLGNLEARLDDWKAAAQVGHEIANHTVSHPCSGNFPFARCNPLEEYDSDRMEAELLEANSAIERLVGVKPRTFAYPCGQTFVGRGEALKSYIPLVAKHFVVGRVAFNEVHNDPSFCDLAHATSLDADDAPFDKVLGWLQAAEAAGGWVILMSHEVGDGGRQITHADTLERVCEYASDAANGVWIDTVATIGEYIRHQRGE
jgi:peptidoglycan-N-acetylglucosamine deacetylase